MNIGELVVKYPEYTVILPQSGKHLSVRSLKVEEEEKLKTSMVTKKRFISLLNEIIYQCIVPENPPIYKNFKDFLETTTLRDREAILFGLYNASYGSEADLTHTCTACQTKYDFKTDLATIFSSTEYDYANSNIIEVRKKIELPVSTNITVFIKQPTCGDELNAYTTIESSLLKNDSLFEVVNISNISYTNSNGSVAEVTDLISIYQLYSRLPVRDRNEISKNFLSEFGGCGIDLKAKGSCISCGFIDTVKVDINSALFSMVYKY